MRIKRLRQALTWCGYLAAFVALYLFAKWLRLDANTLAAIGGAIAAIAAWRAASESSSIARDARDALGHAIRPRVTTQLFDTVKAGDGHRQHSIEIMNKAPWPASDITLMVRYCDGQTEHTRFARLEGARGHIAPKDRGGPTHAFVVRQPQNHENLNGADEVVVQYSDERGLLRWEQRFERHHSHGSDGKFTTHGLHDKTADRRVH